MTSSSQVIAPTTTVVSTIVPAETRLGALDGLRGLMAFWVLVGHACTQSGMTVIPIIRSPRYAVEGFMILSGFLMTYHYCLRARREPWERPATWLKFYMRRFFRISPLYYASLIPAYCLYNHYRTWTSVIGKHVQLPPSTASAPISLTHLLMHVTYLFGMWPAYHASLILPDWSLSLEMQFYVVFPFLMLLATRFGWASLTILGAGIWFAASHLAFAHLFEQPSALPLSILWFLIGMLWANAYVKQTGRRLQLAVLSASCLALISLDTHSVVLVALLAWILFYDGSASFGAAAAAARKALSGGLCRYMADASYSVYLTHLLVLVPISYFLLTKTHVGPLARFAVEVAATSAICYLAARPLAAIENNGISLGRRLCTNIARTES
jgi:peptidoglycan/LPS O-acetylase OafA/YrhL